MYKKLFTVSSFILVLFATFLFSTTPLWADDDVEVEGTIQTIGQDSLVVQNMTFWVNAQTEVRNEHGMRMAFSDLMPGEYVKVEGYHAADGRLIAREIKRKNGMDDDHGQEMEVKGQIQQKDSSSIVVQGVRFFVDGNTMIQKDHMALQFDDLQVGQFVEVKAYQNNNRWIARKIKLEDHDFSELEVEGQIEAIGGDSLIVRGYVFYVNDSTRIRGDHDASLSFNDLSVGDYVEVKAYKDASGKFIALKIKLKTEDSGDHGHEEMDVEGQITHLTDSSMVVNNIYIQLTPNTRFEGRDDMPFSKDSLQVGMYVEVKIQLNNNGVWVAIKVEVKHREGREDNVELEGIVESIGSDSFTVNGILFYVDANTQFFGDHHTPLTFNDLQVNDWVEVKARKQADGSLLAIKVKIESENKGLSRVEVEGIIDTVYAHSIVVNGIEFSIDSSTVIMDKWGNAFTVADLQPGMRVEIKAWLDANGIYVAIKIKIKDLWNAHFEFKAPIDSIAGNTLYFMGQGVLVTDTTIIRDEQGNLVDLSYLSPGMWVKVHGKILEDGTLIALRIKVKNEQQVEVEFTAAIDSVTNTGIYINGYFFLVDNQTEILGLQRQPLTLSDLQAGMIVEVKAIQQTDGTFLALYIKVEDKPSMARMNGVLDGKTDSALMVGNSMVEVTSNTVILDANFNPIAFADLPVGTPITVIVDNNTTTGSSEALQVQESAPGEVTGITEGGQGVVPQEFILGQNYPNPFNPSTTIPVKIAGVEWHQVQLIIYNALGQKVATLFDGALQGGSYQFTWNGRNQFNRPVPSGIYFYQLRIDKQLVSTRKMVLMK